MQKKILEEIANLSSNSAVAACWRQWKVLGAPVSPIFEQGVSSMIDPEALLLLSLGFHGRERRLRDVIGWWAAVGSGLMSVQRLRSMLHIFPDDLVGEVAAFARMASNAGDRRWKPLADAKTSKKETLDIGRPEKQSSGFRKTPELRDPATLLLRLRGGFGNNLKAELLCLLLSMHGRPVTVREIKQALGYSSVAISTAADEMALAGLVNKDAQRPATYSVQGESWTKPLKLEATSVRERLETGSPIPKWRFWPPLFAFLCHSNHWAQERKTVDGSVYILSSQARDLYNQYKDAFVWNQIPMQQPEDFKGPEYLQAFLLDLQDLADWLETHL